MKVTIGSTDESRHVGDIFLYENRVLLLTYHGYIDLKHPHDTWGSGNSFRESLKPWENIKLFKLPKGTKIEIEVGEESLEKEEDENA